MVHFAMTDISLSEEELGQAAREAGISPAQLRTALVERAATTAASASVTSGRNYTARAAVVALAPTDALERVRGSIEAHVGHRGHKQGPGRVDIVDEQRGVVFCITSESYDDTHALVRMEVDGTLGRGKLALGVMGTVVLGVVATLIAASFGAALLVGSLAVAGFVAVLLRRAKTRETAVRQAHSIAARALLGAEEMPEPRSLAGSRDASASTT